MKKQVLQRDGALVRITYGNGAKFVGDTRELPESVFLDCDASWHGLLQKLGDAKSGGTAGEKHAEVLLIWDSLKSGAWNRKGEQGGVDALMPRAFEILDANRAVEWAEKYAGLDEEGKAEVRAKPQVKAAIDKARAEKKLAGVEVDAGDLFEI